MRERQMKPVLTQRGRKWQAKLYVGSTDGKPQYVYGSHEIQGSAIEEAFRKARNFNPASFAEYGNITVGDWLDLHLAQQPMKPSTLSRAKQHFEKHIRPVIGGQPLRSLHQLHIMQVHDAIRRAKLSNSTLRGAHYVLQGALRQAVVAKLIPSNPCLGIKMPPVDTYQGDTLTPEQVLALLGAFEGTFWQDHVMLAAHTGMRRGEILGLRQRDVDVATCTLSIGHTCYAIGGQIVLGLPKTKAGHRKIRIPQAVMDRIALRLTPHLGPDDPVFSNRDGGWQTANAFSDAVRRVSQRLGFKAWTHLFRHSHASLLLANGGDLAAVSKRLGHAKPSITAGIYAHATLDGDQRLSDRSEALLVEQK